MVTVMMSLKGETESLVILSFISPGKSLCLFLCLYPRKKKFNIFFRVSNLNYTLSHYLNTLQNVAMLNIAIVLLTSVPQMSNA